MNDGIDPIDGKRKSGPVPLKKLEEYQTFEEFYDGYKALLDYYLDLSVKAQYHSYEVMNQHVSFLFTRSRITHRESEVLILPYVSFVPPR